MSTKRVIDLANKLQHPENKCLLQQVPKFVQDSIPWATHMMERYGPNESQRDLDGYRLLYILNHYCPSLHHFHPKPDPRRYAGDPEAYHDAAQKHYFENTQAALVDTDGSVLQEGVIYDTENLEAFLSTALPYCDRYYESLWHEFADVPFDDHDDSDMTLAEPWHGFKAGTEREDIWHWFDALYSKGVYALLYGT